MDNLVYRLIKGSDLTGLELDDNFRKLRAAINDLEAQIASLPTGNEVVGVFKPYGGSILPSGYLWANGQTISRTTYADLFAVLGEAFGAGDGMTTFGTPDLRYGVPIGANPMGDLTRVGVTAANLGDYVGAESYSIPHTHTASGSVSIDAINYTPTGTVNVASYVGTAPVTVTVTVDTTNISYTPTGTVTVDETEIAYTPSGSVSVTLTNGAITGAGSINVSGASCVEVQAQEGGTSVIECSSVLTVDAAAIAATLSSNVSVASQDFTGDATNFDHTHTASFAGDATNFNHTHTASAVGSNVNLNHGHSASFTGDSIVFNPTGSALITVDSESPTVSVVQLGTVCNYIIKY